MSVHCITYYMQPRTHQHHHDENCGCGEDNHHDHHESCGCGGDHHHEHGENCGCGGDPDYDLVCTIETLGKWAQFTPTGFLVVSDLTSDEILEKLQPTVTNRDIIFVTKVDPKDVATTIPQCKEWILSVSE